MAEQLQGSCLRTLFRDRHSYRVAPDGGPIFPDRLHEYFNCVAGKTSGNDGMYFANPREGARPHQRDALVIMSEIEEWFGSAGNFIATNPGCEHRDRFARQRLPFGPIP